MNEHPHDPEIEHPVNSTAVSLYGREDAMDDFPVLKAFQQYIDSEQAKARKRLISLGIFFGILMGAVIAVFLVILFNITERNQSLNDRLIEFAMKERTRHEAPVVVQPPVQQDNSAILQLTSKIEAMQNRLIESQKRADEAERAQKAAESAQKAAAEAAAAALVPKAPSPQELEIARLKALLDAEKEKTAVEKAKLREAELEAYRRKHYPECYAQPKPARSSVAAPVVLDDDESEDEIVVPQKKFSARGSAKPKKQAVAQQSPKKTAPKVKVQAADPEEVLSGKAIRYFEDDDEEEVEENRAVPKTSDLPKVEVKEPEAAKQPETTGTSPSSQAATTNAASAAKEEKTTYAIPVEVRGKQSTWRLPD